MSQFWYFALADNGWTWGYAVICIIEMALITACIRSKYIHLPLLALMYCSLLLHLLNAVIEFDHWWSAFWMNRLFDLSLLYVAGCAIFGIFRLRRKQKGAPLARPQSSRLFAAA
ncbi:MAG: hypothetical protein ACKVS5_08975 [Parvularculaceae bacterium]